MGCWIMRVRTVTQEVYKFPELSDVAKQKAVSDYAEHGMDGWDEYSIEYAREVLEFCGVKDVKIRYSGFSSQGDGASFTGTWYASCIQRESLAQVEDAEARKFIDLISAAPDGLSATLKPGYGSNFYSHENTVNIEFDIPDYGNEDGQYEAAEIALDGAFRDAMRWIYHMLEKEYGYQTSEELFAELAEANEWEFFLSGKLA